MRNLYSRIWIDAILSFKKHNPNSSEWKIVLFTFITWMNALNMWVIFVWLNYLGILKISLPEFDIFPGETIDSFVTFIIVFASPFAVINYFFAFYQNRYKRMLENFNGMNGKLAMRYTLLSTLGAFVSAIILGILN